MPLQTTVIGSYPKPGHLDVPSWFELRDHSALQDAYGKFLRETKCTADYQDAYQKALGEVVREQTELGIDVITDGELDRESYVWFLCRHLQGFSFENKEIVSYRNGACHSTVPQVVGPVGVGDSCEVFVSHWKDAKAYTSSSVKVTIPGPLTVIGSSQNKFYEDEKELSLALVAAVKKIIAALIEAGCRHIQIDEPVFMREVKKSLDFGIDHVSRCIEDCGDEVTTAIHLCCGYPNHLDQIGYQKADSAGYFELAPHIDQAGFNEVSIEDTHRRNDLSLLSLFKRSKVILGSVAIASSEVETEDEIRARLKSALNFIPADRLVVAPDCGLGYLPRDLTRRKLNNMVRAAKSLP